MAHRSRHDPGSDPFADLGYWGSPTSTANFCEEDYAVTRYIAEFFNTLTNLAYVYYAFKSPGQGKLIFGMDSMAVSLVFVGVFSFVFHASLHRDTQFLDEMSMFFLGCAFLQPLYTNGFSSSAQKAITTLLLSVVVVISAVYYQTRIVELHWGSFFIMENLIWTRALYLTKYRNRSAAEKSRLGKQFWAATGTMALGIIVWLIDLELCPPLRRLRALVGPPWEYVLELHGWWHILTAIAASKYIELIRDISRHGGEAVSKHT